MSLSSILLPKKGKIDSELDSLFQSKPVVVPPPAPQHRSKKRKIDAVADEAPLSPSKIRKPAPKPIESPPKPRKAKGKGKVEAKEISEEEEGSGDDEKNLPSDHTMEEDSGADELVHESVSGVKKRKPQSAKLKYTPNDETPAQRNARTIFIGNLSPELAQKKALVKQLHKHILTLVPSAKIESTRFRSVAFQTPTSRLPDDEGKTPDARPRDRERAASWRNKQGKESVDEAKLKTDEKKFLTPAEKKRIAFINHDFHSTADNLNAYVVFAHPIPADVLAASRPANLPPLPPTLDPYEAARFAVKKCDGTTFMDRQIRVDAVSKVEQDAATTGLGSTDPKLCVFVGNLEFASKEEDVRAFFEGVMCAERGPPPGNDTDEGSSASRWVQHVRIIRDRDTQLGKGFAYVQFADRQCVDELLAMEPGSVKFAKRKLRVQRCKTLPGGSGPKPSLQEERAPNPKSSPSKLKPAAGPIPKGNPELGEKLAHLSKEDRKKAKAADPDRVKRRLAKKKARDGVVAVKDRRVPSRKSGDRKGGEKGGKERHRERKPRKAGGGPKRS